MSSVPIPSKGDIVTIENKQYRVLKVSGTVVEVLTMYDASTSQLFNATSKKVTFTGGTKGQQYQYSDLDKYLNETFFATLSATLRAAIVPKAINQDMWYYSSSAPSSGTYYHMTYGSSNVYYFDNKKGTAYGIAEVGSRNVYALSIKDVIDYLGISAGGDFADTDIWQMFWNRSTYIEEYIWLRSAYQADSNYAFFVRGNNGRLSGNNYSSRSHARPAFQIDWDILYPSTPTLTFKHFFDAGTIGTGTVKFRHYSQQEPSSGGEVTLLVYDDVVQWYDITKISGNFVGTLTLNTSNNNGNKIQCGPKGYEWIPKMNDLDPLFPSYSDIAQIFGIINDDMGTEIVPSEWGTITPMVNRVTNNGSDGGSCTFSAGKEELAEISVDDTRLLVYDSSNDTMTVQTLSSTDGEHKLISTKTELGYGQIFAVMRHLQWTVKAGTYSWNDVTLEKDLDVIMYKDAYVNFISNGMEFSQISADDIELSYVGNGSASVINFEDRTIAEKYKTFQISTDAIIDYYNIIRIALENGLLTKLS